jgi:4-hydroxybenzoate polyprenyltransferase
MGKTLYLLLKTARPRQWIKNFALYATLVFSGLFADNFSYVLTVTYAFVVFCILSSSIYIVNDIVDIESDRKHPYKKKRPIASGQLPVPTALFYAVSGGIAVIFLSLSLNPFFFYLVLTYTA